MRSRKALLGLMGIGVLAVASVVGALIGQSLLADSASALLMAAIGSLLIYVIVVLRRIEREVRRLKGTVGQAPPRPVSPTPKRRETHSPDSAPAMSAADLVGTIRLLQAQYVGRLDHAQAALEAAAEQVRSAGEQEN